MYLPGSRLIWLAQCLLCLDTGLVAHLGYPTTKLIACGLDYDYNLNGTRNVRGYIPMCCIFSNRICRICFATANKKT